MGETLYIGTAGWSIPRATAHRFDREGTQLQRYARHLRCAEINSSFHRPHAATTYAKWAGETPSEFRFAVKIPRTITHDLRLRRVRAPLERFLAESAGLGNRRGPLLVQLPPSLAFEARSAAPFFNLLRARHEGWVVCEPRHATWFTPQADALLVRYQIARVAADPPPVPGGDLPGGWGGIVYVRLHGSPRKYWSRYSDAYITSLARSFRAKLATASVWCVFDNTASGAALENACELHEAVNQRSAEQP